MFKHNTLEIKPVFGRLDNEILKERLVRQVLLARQDSGKSKAKQMRNDPRLL